MSFGPGGFAALADFVGWTGHKMRWPILRLGLDRLKSVVRGIGKRQRLDRRLKDDRLSHNVSTQHNERGQKRPVTRAERARLTEEVG